MGIQIIPSILFSKSKRIFIDLKTNNKYSVSVILPMSSDIPRSLIIKIFKTIYMHYKTIHIYNVHTFTYVFNILWRLICHFDCVK